MSRTTAATADFSRSTAPTKVVLNLVPAVLGSGRPFFGAGGLAEPVLFDDPRIVAGRRVTHLVHDVRR